MAWAGRRAFFGLQPPALRSLACRSRLCRQAHRNKAASAKMSTVSATLPAKEKTLATLRSDRRERRGPRPEEKTRAAGISSS